MFRTIARQLAAKSTLPAIQMRNFRSSTIWPSIPRVSHAKPQSIANKCCSPFFSAGPSVTLFHREKRMQRIELQKELPQWQVTRETSGSEGGNDDVTISQQLQR